MGLEIRLPDVNRSAATWTAEADPGARLADARAIRVGLGQVAEVEAATVEGVVAERDRAGPFVSLTDFCARVPIGIAAVHRLVDAGCFDAFDLTRPQAKWKTEALLRGWEGAGSGADTLFPRGAWRELAAEPVAPALADYPVGERRRREWEILGVSPRHHPIEFWRDEVAAVRARGGRGRVDAPPIVAAALGRHAGRRVTLVGFLTTTKRVRTKRAEPMMFLTLEDETALYDVVLFPRAYQRYGSRLFDRGPYVVTGRVEDDPRPSSVTAETVARLEEAVG